MRGGLPAKGASEIVARTLSYLQLLRQWDEDRSYILYLVVLTPEYCYISSTADVPVLF